jgi:hypothetical protein
MRGMISRGHTPGVYYYHGKDGMIIIDDKNKDAIRRDAEELSKEIFKSDWICPQAMFKSSIDGKISKTPSNDVEKVMNWYEKIIRSM